MNGFILVFGMVLVLAVERRFAADRAAVGGPARSRQSRPVAGCPPAAVRPCSRCPPRGRVPSPQPTAQHHDWIRLRKRSRCPTLHLRQRSPCPTAARMRYGEKRACCTFAQLWATSLARSRCGAFSGVQSWRDYAVVRSRAAIRGGFFASCVPEGASDGKSAHSWQHIAAMHPKRAGFGKIFAPCIRKAPQTAA